MEMIEEIARRRFTFASELDRRALETPDKVFLWFDDEPVTFAETQRRVRSAANQLLGLGVNPGDTVALLTLSCPEWVSVWLACAQIGAISMPINVMFRGEFLRHQLNDSGATVLLLDARFYPQVAEIAADLTSLDTIILRGSLPPGADPLPGVNMVETAVLLDGPTDAVHGGRPTPWNEIACLFYTSGTTGPSKGALLTQQYLCVAAHALNDAYGMGSSDVVYSAMPLFHLGGAYAVIVASLVAGRSAVLDSAFSVSQCWDRVRKYQATVFLGVGPMVAMLQALPPDPDDSTLPIRLVVAAPVPADLQRQVEERYQCTVVQAYGQTEAIPVAMHQPGNGSGGAPGSAGRLSPLHDVRIVDDDDFDVRPGGVGEIVIRPRYPQVMFEGYLNRPAETLQQQRNLWFHTGDLGRIDADGNLWWVDRKKDAIRRRGENISSFEIEQSVLSHPQVVECAAIAVPSPVGEDDVKICVVLAPDSDLTPKDLIGHCADRMPSFAVPRYIEILATLPKNSVGRIQKHILRQRPEAAGTWDRVQEGFEVRR
jgi:crotonobetaine/carnitine-CoA ligase